MRRRKVGGEENLQIRVNPEIIETGERGEQNEGGSLYWRGDPTTTGSRLADALRVDG